MRVRAMIDDKMEDVDEIRSDLKFNQKNMLKARTASEAIAEKIKASEGVNQKAISSLKEAITNCMSVFKISFQLEDTKLDK